MFKIGEIRELIRLLDETSLSEIQVEAGEMKLHLKKPDAAPVVVSSAREVVPAVAQPVPSNQSGQTVVASGSTAETSAPDEHVHVVTSPMVGTLYRAPSPDAPSFVDVGSQVGSKTVVCIVEAMKLMNEIESEVTGEVVEVLVQNGQLVEYGQPLFKIRLA